MAKKVKCMTDDVFAIPVSDMEKLIVKIKIGL